MLKSEELLQPTSCLNKAAPNELVFVLRAKDPLAPQTLRHWAAMAQGKHEPEKIAEALACADCMDKWRQSRFDSDGRPRPEVAPPVNVR